MTKQFRSRFSETIDIDGNFLSDAIEGLQRLLTKHDNVEICCEDGIAQVVYYEEETDYEYKERLIQEERREKYDRELFAVLKAKFEPQL